MPVDRKHHKCHPRTVEEFQKKVDELRKWVGILSPPAHSHEEWLAGFCAEPSDFTGQLIQLRDALQPSGEPDPSRAR